jgi:hypothetical protein
VSRAQIFESLYQVLLADQVLLDLLGPVSPANVRVLRSYPQLQSLLTDMEPQDEGWLVLDEAEPTLQAVHTQLSTMYDVVEPQCSVFATRFSLCDDVIDRLDQQWHWTVDQQRAVTFGERILLSTRRFRTKDSFNSEVKLYQKDTIYRMELVLQEQIS